MYVYVCIYISHKKPTRNRPFAPFFRVVHARILITIAVLHRTHKKEKEERKRKIRYWCSFIPRIIAYLTERRSTFIRN